MKYGLEDINEYFDIYKNESCLDGWFTAGELRQIANKMDELNRTCNYCTNAPTKCLVWLKDKNGRPARISVLWCGCDLQTALTRFWDYPHTVREGIDYEVEQLDIDSEPFYRCADCRIG